LLAKRKAKFISMIYYILFTFLISLSPAGEGRVGIPYGVLNEIPILLSFIVGLSANLLVFPLFYKAISLMNHFLWKYKSYKKAAVYLSKKAKRTTQNSIKKYGAWGLMVFVMIPLPVTGAYMGTIAAYILGMDYKRSFIATSVGVTIACTIITLTLYFIDSEVL
jgi:uncharacterized membrane protein